MADNLLDRYGGPVPRYTSYPTAPHFHDGITSGLYENWLSELPTSEPVSLYLHVPFCQSMCWYCGCQTKIVNKYAPINDYAHFLAIEIERVSQHLGRRQPVSHIHWGGGTPTMLSPEDFAALMARLQTQFNIRHDAEIAIEIDPRSLTGEMINTLARTGINRVSLGIQDFNPSVQQAINRHQSFTQTKAVVDELRRSGVRQISLDLMYGLPRQTQDDARRTVDLCIDLDADRYSVFGYAHVPWMKSHQKLINDNDLPDGPERMAQAQAIADQLQSHGYLPIGLDHFSRPDDTMAKALDSGKLRRNFQGYTTDTANTLIGFGVSAIGRLPQGYVQNLSSERQYKQALKQGGLPVQRGFALSPEDALRRRIIECLMCDLSVDLAHLCQQTSTTVSQFAEELAQLQQMQTDGLVCVEGNHIQVTETGQPYIRSLCAVFDQYLETGKGRHSLAV